MPGDSLIELQLRIGRSPGDGGFELRRTLLDRGPVPPVPQLIGSRVELRSRSEVLEERQALLGPAQLDALLDHVGRLSPRRYERYLGGWLRFEVVGHARVDRVALALEPPFDRVAWERLLADVVGDDVPVVRRLALEPVPRHDVFDLPLRLGLRSPYSPRLDDLVAALREIDERVVQLVINPEPGEPLDVEHVIGVPREAPPRGSPRLLVSETLGGPPPWFYADDTARLLGEGVDAMIVSDWYDPRFAAELYRGVARNVPLDRAYADAGRHSPRADRLIMLREGGEYSLQLSQALAAPEEPPAPRLPEQLLEDGSAQRFARALWSSATNRMARRRDERRSSAARLFAMPSEHTTERIVEERLLRRGQGERDRRQLAALADLDPEALHDAAVRTTSAWLSRHDEKVSPHAALTVGVTYDLHVKVGRPEALAPVSDGIPPALIELLRQEPAVKLEVGVFSPDFELERARTTLTVPNVGDSDDATMAVTPLHEGRARLRIGLYHRNVLLQSCVLEVDVRSPWAPAASAEPQSGGIDYVASPTLSALAQLPPATLNLTVNGALDGTHWIGVFTGRGGHALRDGSLRTLSDDDLKGGSQALRRELAKVAGEDAYAYSQPWAEVKLNKLMLEARIKGLERLATAGWVTCAQLLYGDDDVEGVPTLHDVEGEAIVSVARCRSDGPGVPWAALYDRSLDQGAATGPSLCGVFIEQLLANEWTDDGALVEAHDLLDDPPSCRAQASCPLDGPDSARTVCPFGFWGFAHQVEQPLQQVQLEEDGAPVQLADPAYTESSLLSFRPAVKRSALMGVWPQIPGVTEHRDALVDLGLDVDYCEERDTLCDRIFQGGSQFVYFYCHGEVEPQQNVFQLKLGPAATPGYISHATFAGRQRRWPPPSSLVVMNGCETMAVTPEVGHKLWSRFRRFGASGVVGTEIKVWSQLAGPFGAGVLRRMLRERATLGEAFLAERRRLLRELNPLGLAYSFYAPAALHLHPLDGDCERCAPY